MRFKNRTDAGEKLAAALAEWKGKEGVVFALPRGGVVVGQKVADSLSWPMDLIIVRKVGHPDSSEYAIAAVAEDGDVVKNEQEVAGVSKGWFEERVQEEMAEAKRRREKYLAGREAQNVKGKTAILVDDGIATGLTIKAALKELRHHEPKEIVVAVPVAPSDSIGELSEFADRVICLHSPEIFFGAIGSYYDSFEQVTDDEVVSIMKSI